MDISIGMNTMILLLGYEAVYKILSLTGSCTVGSTTDRELSTAVCRRHITSLFVGLVLW
jgi:hypothetical protein